MFGVTDKSNSQQTEPVIGHRPHLRNNIFCLANVCLLCYFRMNCRLCTSGNRMGMPANEMSRTKRRAGPTIAGSEAPAAPAAGAYR
jgi:hypothetical protein